MKKILTLIITALFTITTYAQNDVTKFLGIPVDGTKDEMIQKLKAKGFKSAKYQEDILEGEFNGRDVSIHVITNGNKVYRIMVADAIHSNETDIKIRFNNLCRQFNKNKKYTSLSDDTIPEDEDISSQMSIYNKRFEAAFFQNPEMLINPEKMDTAYIQQEILSRLTVFYTPEQLSNPTDEIKKKMQQVAIEYALELVQNKIVWFKIAQYGYDEYGIIMYYDNEYNHADGEDL